MAGQVWGTNASGGYMYTDELSDVLRMALQPLMRFRQHSFVEDAKGKNAGDLFHWNIYSDVETAGGTLVENVAMPETNFTISQGSLTIVERGKLFAALLSKLMNNFRSIVVGFNMTVMA